MVGNARARALRATSQRFFNCYSNTQAVAIGDIKGRPRFLPGTARKCFFKRENEIRWKVFNVCTLASVSKMLNVLEKLNDLNV